MYLQSNTLQNECCLLASWRSRTKIAGSGSGTIDRRRGSGSVTKCHGSTTLVSRHLYLVLVLTCSDKQLHKYPAVLLIQLPRFELNLDLRFLAESGSQIFSWIWIHNRENFVEKKHEFWTKKLCICISFFLDYIKNNQGSGYASSHLLSIVIFFPFSGIISVFLNAVPVSGPRSTVPTLFIKINSTGYRVAVFWIRVVPDSE